MRIGNEYHYQQYIAGEKAHSSNGLTDASGKSNKSQKDTVEISEGVRELQARSVKTSSKGVEISFDEEKQNYQIFFKNIAYVYRTVKNGYIDVGNKKIELSTELKDELTAKADELKERMTQETLNAAAEHNMKVLEQQAEALSGESEKDRDMMDILRRIMRGEKVSPADEKKLAEYNMEMYSMAKQAATMAERDGHTSHGISKEKQDDKKGSSEFDSPLKHLHEYTVSMNTKIVDNVFADYDVNTEEV